jgi:hypothetical protein
MIKQFNQTDAEWMEYISKGYNKKTLLGVKYYLDYTGDIDGVLKEFNLQEEVLMAMLLAHFFPPYFIEESAYMQNIVEKMNEGYPQESSYNGNISNVSTIQDLKNYLKFTDDMNGLVKKFDTTPEIIKALVCSYPALSLLCPDLDPGRKKYRDIEVQFLLDTMKELDYSIEKCLRYLQIEKYGYVKACLVKEALSKVRTIRDLMYYVAYTGDIDGLGKKFSATPEMLKSIIWYYSTIHSFCDKDNLYYNLYAQETIDKWKEKFEQEFSIRNSPISSVKTVQDMRVYRDLTGDVNGLMNKFGITASEIEEMIQYYTDWNADWREVQRIIDNPEEEASLAYERAGINQRDLTDRAWGLQCEREDICGIGTRNVRSFLTKQYKHEGDKLAQLYQLAIDIEDKSILIKTIDWLDCKLSYDEQDELKIKMEEQKFKLLRKLIKCYEQSGYEYGWRKAYEDVLDDVYIYFDLPNNHQISFRTILSEKEKEEIPRYTKKWNGMVRYTLEMIGEDLIVQYPELKEISESGKVRKRPGVIEKRTKEFFRKYVY